MTKNSIEKQLQGYRLTMAEIIYHLADYPYFLQSFIWQTMDIAPTFPSIRSIHKKIFTPLGRQFGRQATFRQSDKHQLDQTKRVSVDRSFFATALS